MNYQFTTKGLRHAAVVAWFLLCVAVGLSFAQSNDVEYPTPVRENPLEGRIVARDLGDARLTQHFYVFTGMPGDILLKVESANLEGDLDLFRAAGLQPLLKVGMYSGGGLSIINKSAYLKRRETLILRIEARTPDDQPGTYKITFGGAFEVYGGPEIIAPPIAGNLPDSKQPKVRVNSAGARLDIPEEAKPAPTPEATIAATPPTPAKPKGRTRVPQPKPTPSPEPASATEPEIASTIPAPPKPKPARKGKVTRAKPVPTKPTPAPTAVAATEPESAPPPPKPKTTTTAKKVKPPVAAKPKPVVVQTQLLLELKDGTRVVRENARRVTIEKGVIVVITAEGKIERYSLLDITKMSVEPAVTSEPKEN